MQYEAVVLEELILESRDILIWNLDVLAALLAEQVVVMIAVGVIFVVQPPIDRDRRNQADTLQPLQGAIDRRDINIWLMRHDRGVYFFCCTMRTLFLDHLEYLHPLRCQTMALFSQAGGFFKMVHGCYLPNASDNRPPWSASA